MMDDKNTTEYLERLRSVSLSADVKARMRDELSSFADFHAMTNQTTSGAVGTQMHFFMYFSRPLQATLAVLVLLVGTTGVSFGAQSALPGDPLYGVKVLVQEKIQSSLALDSDAQAKVQADIFAERLQEARKLVLEGKRDIATSKEVRMKIDAQREKALKAATEASPETQLAVQTDVVTDYTYTQKILTASRPLFASAQGGVSVMALEPSQGRSATVMMDTSYGMGGAEDSSMLTTDAKMIPEYIDIDPVVEGDLILPLLSERVAFLQTALLENTVEVSAEIKSEIEKDLARALSLWYGADQERAYEIVTYIETFLGIKLEATQQTDVYMDTGSDSMQIEPMPMPPDTGMSSEPGFGGAGTSGSYQGEIDLMYTEDRALPFESDVVDMGIEVESSLQIEE